MKKQLTTVRNLLSAKITSLTEQKKSASLTDDQKSKIDSAMTEIQTALNELDSAEAEATTEQLVAVFSKAIESLSASSDVAVASLKSEMQAEFAKVQAKIGKSAGAPKKFKAHMSFSNLAKAEANKDGYKPFSAGVDVTAYTPDSEVDNVAVYHPVVGVLSGFEISSTSTPQIRVRKFAKGSGKCAVVLNHGAKPVIEFVGAQSLVNVATYAGVVENIADEDLEDNAGLEAEIQMEALTDLAMSENEAGIALLNGVAQAFANATFGTKADADEKTALSAIIDQVQIAIGNRVSDISLALNSSQWAKLKDLRNSNGTPIDIASVIGNVNQIVDNTLTSDNFLCWAKAFAKLKIYKQKTNDWYKGVQVTTDQGNITAVHSEWRTDESSLRVRQREVLYVTDNTTVVKGTISGVVTALKTQQP